MPRKKKDDLSTPTEIVASTQLEEKPKRPAKKKEEPVAVQPPVVVAKPAKKSAPTIAEKKPSTKKAPKLVAPEPVAEEVQVPEVVESTPVTAKPVRRRLGAKAAAEAAVAPTVRTIPASYSEDEESLPVLEWRPRKVKEEAPVAVEGDGPVAPRRSRRRGRGRDSRPEVAVQAATEVAATPAEPFIATLLSDEDGEFEMDLSVSFRPRSSKPTAVPSKRSESRVEPAPELVAANVAEPVVVVKRPVTPKPPLIPPKPNVVIPNDAPQVILRNGVPTLVKAGRVFPPMMFFGNSQDERRAATVQSEIKLAGEAGIHIHTHFIDFTVDEASVDASASFAAYLLSQTLATDPDAHVLFRIAFAPPRNWENKFPDGFFLSADGSPAEPSICDDKYWEVARKSLNTFIKKLRLLPNADRIMGLHLDRAEWFVLEDRGQDASRSALYKFRDWLRTRYSNDEVTLRAAWFDGTASFDRIQIPDFNSNHAGEEKFVRSSRKQRRYVDYHLFMSDITVARISELAYDAKLASDGYFLMGVSYGYTFEWSHPGSGHLALGKLLRLQELDFIAGPPSYKNREPGGTSPFPIPIDSLVLNGKLFISEEDFKTSLSGGHEPDDFNPVIKTPQALDSVQWRGAGAALAHGSGISWMDLWGNGWLKTAAIWQRANAIKDLLVMRMATVLKDPDVIVFIDERALAYLVDANAFSYLVQNVRESVLRSGMSAGFYLLSDLAHREKFPDGKLYLFLNAWDIRPELRAAIKNRLQRENKVLFWLYSAGLFDNGRESLERAREVTGIALKPQPFYSKSGTKVLNKRNPLCEAFPDRGLVGGTKLEPSYFAIPEESTVLGEYTQTGLPSFVIKEFSGDGDPSLAWKSVFLGEPMVTADLIRALGQMAGAHIYNFHEDVVHAGAPFLTVHCHKAGPRAITLPQNWAAYNLQTRQYIPTDGNSIRFTALEGSTHAFLAAPLEELEALLAQDFGSLLKIDELPPKPLNTFQQDTVNFDIPIMKLGEWMEGGVSDESEDWLMRPLVVEDAPEEDESLAPQNQTGRRRRRRGGRNTRDEAIPQPRGQRHTEVVSVTDSGDNFEMNVTFRKRD